MRNSQWHALSNTKGALHHSFLWGYGCFKTQHHANLRYKVNLIVMCLMLWNLVDSAKKLVNLYSYSYSNKIGQLIDMRLVWDIPLSPFEIYQVFAWSLHDSLAISKWFSGHFHLISFHLFSRIIFKTHLKNSYFQYSTLSQWHFSNSLLTVLSKGPHKIIVWESHMKMFIGILAMTLVFLL